MKVRLSDHSVGQDVIDTIVKRFEDRGMNRECKLNSVHIEKLFIFLEYGN